MANNGGPPGYLYCEFSWLTHTHRWPCGGRCAAFPNSGDCSSCERSSQFGDGLFQAGLAGGLLFNPDRAAGPWEIVAAFAVLFLPYSVLGPFAGALLDRWDRRLVLVGANLGRLVLMLGIAALLAAGASDLPILFGALIANGFTRFVSSGLSAALPDVVPRQQVVTMNSVATATGGAAAFLGAGFMLVPRWLFGARDTGAAAIIFIVVIPVSVALLLSVRFPPHVLGPHASQRADPRVGRVRGGHRMAARRAHRAGSPRPSLGPSPGWPHTEWCSVSTPCWCWSWCDTATPRMSRA